MNIPTPGDFVELEYPDKSFSDTKTTTTIRGTVICVFDALTSDGKPEINLEIDIRTISGGWFRWKPAIDNGTITILETGNRYARKH